MLIKKFARDFLKTLRLVLVSMFEVIIFKMLTPVLVMNLSAILVLVFFLSQLGSISSVVSMHLSVLDK